MSKLCLARLSFIGGGGGGGGGGWGGGGGVGGGGGGGGGGVGRVTQIYKILIIRSIVLVHVVFDCFSISGNNFKIVELHKQFYVYTIARVYFLQGKAMFALGKVSAISLL